jgi:hypothetical protein
MAVTHEHTGERRGFFSEVAPMTPLTESAAGVAVIILAILGLAHVAPASLAAIAVIVTGGAFLLQMATEAGGYGLAWATSENTDALAVEFGGGMAVEFLAGGTGIVLGILALLGIAPLPLTATAVIIFGAVLLISGGMAAQVSAQRIAASPTVDPALRAMARHASGAATAARALIGLTAIVLGILALVQFEASILLLVGLLAVGAALLLSSAATAAADVTALRK